MRTQLLDFVSIRNPQTISDIEIENFYITLPDELVPQSHYYSNLQSDTFKNLQFELKRRSGTFSPTTEKELNERFSAHLVQFQNYLSTRLYNDLDLSNTNLRLNDQDRTTLWDNYAHFQWVDRDEDTQEIISNILKAEKFFVKYLEFAREETSLSSEEEKCLLRILEQGEMVLTIPIVNIKETVSVPKLSQGQKQMLSDAVQNLKDRESNLQLTNLSQDIVAVESQLSADKRALAIEEQQKTKAELLVKAKELGMAVESKEFKNLFLTNNRLKETPILKEEIKEKLSTKTLKTLNRIDQNNLSFQLIKEEIESQRLELLTSSEKLPVASVNHTVNIEGNLLSIEQTLPEDSWMVTGSKSGENGINYYLVHYSNNKQELELNRVSGRIHIDQETIVIDTSTPISSTSNGFQGFLLNDDAIEIMSSLSVHMAEFELEFNRPTEFNGIIPSKQFTIFATGDFSDIIAPQEVESDPSQPTSLFGVERLEIADFKRIEQEIACYVPGEVSHIENIMAREFKEKISRKLVSSEVETEITDEFTSEYMSDTETTDRTEMLYESETVLEEERSRELNFNTSVAGEFGVGKNTLTFGADFGGSFSKSNSKSESNKQSLEKAKTYTRRIQNKITKKRTSKKRSLSKREFEDINKHGFDNKSGDDHVVGIFRRIDKVYNNYLVNYGKRLTYEFVIPEPAINYIWSHILKIGASILSQKKLTPPKSPETFGILKWNHLSTTNYLDLAAEYGLDVEAPPEEYIMTNAAISQQIRGEGEENTDHSANYNELIIPDGYVGQHLYLNGHFDKHRTDADNSVIAITIGNQLFAYDFEVGNEFGHGAIDSDRDISVSLTTGMVPIAVTSNDIGGYSLIARIKCKMKTNMLKNWKLKLYNQITAAYEEKLDIYEDAIAKQLIEIKKQNKTNFNSGKNRLIEEQELKLTCIKMLTEPFSIGISQQHYLVDHLPPKVIPWDRLTEHSDMAKFLESAFDWNLMAYTFYPYYYLHQSLWYQKMNLKGGSDPLFQSFLKAGFARVKVPIRKGREQEVMNFLETGKTTKKKPQFVLGIKNKAYLSVLNELATADEEVVLEKTWQSKIPTNLTILQKNAGGLDLDGLPCDGTDNPIAIGDSMLQPENHNHIE